MSFFLLNLFHTKYCLLHTFTQHSPLTAQSVALRFVEPFQSQVSYFREMLHISLVFSMLGKRWNLFIKKWFLFSHIFPLMWNTIFTYCILMTWVLLWFTVLVSLIFIAICCFWVNFLLLDFVFQLLGCLLQRIHLKKKLWNKFDTIY